MVHSVFITIMGVCVYRRETSIVPSIPAPFENKQLATPSNITAFGVPVFEANTGKFYGHETVTTLVVFSISQF